MRIEKQGAGPDQEAKGIRQILQRWALFDIVTTCKYHCQLTANFGFIDHQTTHNHTQIFNNAIFLNPKNEPSQ